MPDFPKQVRLYAGDGGKKMIQELFGRHPEFPPPGRNLNPSLLVPVIPLGKRFGADEDEIRFVSQFHLKGGDVMGSPDEPGMSNNRFGPDASPDQSLVANCSIRVRTSFFTSAVGSGFSAGKRIVPVDRL